jgi:hypothetical protein
MITNSPDSRSKTEPMTPSTLDTYVYATDSIQERLHRSDKMSGVEYISRAAVNIIAFDNRFTKSNYK